MFYPDAGRGEFPVFPGRTNMACDLRQIGDKRCGYRHTNILLKLYTLTISPQYLFGE